MAKKKRLYPFPGARRIAQVDLSRSGHRSTRKYRLGRRPKPAWAGCPHPATPKQREDAA